MKKQRLEELARELSSFEVLEIEPLTSISGGCSGTNMNCGCLGPEHSENGAVCPETRAAEAATRGLSNR